MAIFGWLILVGIGLYVIVQTLSAHVVSMGFSGRSSWGLLIPFAIGAATLYFAFTHAPFQIIMR